MLIPSKNPLGVYCFFLKSIIVVAGFVVCLVVVVHQHIILQSLCPASPAPRHWHHHHHCLIHRHRPKHITSNTATGAYCYCYIFIHCCVVLCDVNSRQILPIYSLYTDLVTVTSSPTDPTTFRQHLSIWSNYIATWG